jgi:hypothetical protein
MSVNEPAQPRDWNMAIAELFARELGPTPPVPSSLMDVNMRARFVDEMDGPFIPDTDDVRQFLAAIARRLAAIDAVARRHMPDVADGLVRVNIALRLWAGCISAAKTIAHETRSGPNTPAIRREQMTQIDEVAQADAIFAAGVEAGPVLKGLRGQGYSFEGVATNARVRRYG